MYKKLIKLCVYDQLIISNILYCQFLLSVIYYIFVTLDGEVAQLVRASDS